MADGRFGIISTIGVGHIVGFIAGLVTPERENMGLIAMGLRGIAGSLAATHAGQAVGWYAARHAAGWIASVVGALAL